MQSIRDVAPNIVSRIAVTGTVEFITEVEGKTMAFLLDNVLCIPEAEYGLFSPGLAFRQGFTFKFDNTTQVFTVSLEDRVVAVAKPQDATWRFQVKFSS